MNTRLQVEHPVTELITGLDLVHLQITIASGELLPLAQPDVSLRGHAIECRIYAEDHENGFMPSPGRITRLIQPSGPGIREDSGIYEGWTVPMEYDPMLSKLIAFAPTRALAIARLQRALEEYVIGGIRTNLGLFRRILNDREFQAGCLDTSYLDRLLVDIPVPASVNPLLPERRPDDDIAAVAAGLFRKLGAPDRETKASGGAPTEPAWKQLGRREGLRS